MGGAERKRLHITPFNAELFSRLVPVELASSVSFHSVQTFPERGFGFVDLPAMEAEKVKGKFHGAILKGMKIRVEDARPLKERGEGKDGEERKEGRRKKGGRQQGVMEGYELEEGRRVKRGWVEEVEDGIRKTRDPGNEREVVPGMKLRFKTSIPSTALSAPEKTDGGRKGKKKKAEIKSKSKRVSVVVEEFARSKKPTASDASPTTTTRWKGIVACFEEGKGWVDGEGNVIEAAPASTRPKATKMEPSTKEKLDILFTSESAHDTPVSKQCPLDSNSSNRASETSSPTSAGCSSSDSTAEDQDSIAVTPPSRPMHPLEALFKRPPPPESTDSKPRPQPIDTSFSFFSSSGGDEAGVAAPPQTPHTRADLEWRAMRSAAPTPDTAAMGKKFNFSFPDNDDEEEEEEEKDREDDVGMEEGIMEGGGGGAGREGESEFRRWFYENRGDLNRGWKKRRREEKKAKRQRENRRVSRRIA